jgi:chromate transporter
VDESAENKVITDQSDTGTSKCRGNVKEVLLLFLRLGATSFGGPAAHTAIMHDEVVRRRKWLSDQKFLDLIGVTNLIPGPNSTEMAIHIGFLRAGWPGLIAGGLGFIMPAFCIVLILAWAYVRYGSSPQVGWILYGIKPVVIAIILQALWQLSRKALKGYLLFIIGAGVVLGYFLGVNEIILLFGGGLIVLLAENFKKIKTSGHLSSWLPMIGFPALATTTFSSSLLFLSFLKIGAVLYGSGYVLLAFLRSEFVLRLGWLTEKQLLDAVAIGQFTPGPFFTTATFIGYVLGGFKGAILATTGIFLPSFIFVAISYRLLQRYKDSRVVRSLLNGVNASALGLMAAVAWQLGLASITDLLTVLIALGSFILLSCFKVNSTWLIVGGGVIGMISTFFR